jgi:hypothetical protein
MQLVCTGIVHHVIFRQMIRWQSTIAYITSITTLQAAAQDFREGRFTTMAEF